MVAVDDILGDMAAYLHDRLREDRVLREQLRTALEQGRRLCCQCSLGPWLPEDTVTICISRPVR